MPEGAAGSVRLASGAQRSLAAFMRTYTLEQGSGGQQTYGQYVAPWQAADAVVPGFEGRIVGLSHTRGFRTNLLLVNTHAGPDRTGYRSTTAQIEVLDGCGVLRLTDDLVELHAERIADDRNGLGEHRGPLRGHRRERGIVDRHPEPRWTLRVG